MPLLKKIDRGVFIGVRSYYEGVGAKFLVEPVFLLVAVFMVIP